MKKASHKAYIKGNMAGVSHGYMWEMIPGYYLKGSFSKKTYTVYDDALTICAKNDACKGVSLKNNKFHLNSKTTYVKKKGTACWIQRGATVLYKSYYWTKATGYKGETYKPLAAYTSLAVAKTKCLASATVSTVLKLEVCIPEREI